MVPLPTVYTYSTYSSYNHTSPELQPDLGSFLQKSSLMARRAPCTSEKTMPTMTCPFSITSECCLTRSALDAKKRRRTNTSLPFARRNHVFSLILPSQHRAWSHLAKGSNTRQQQQHKRTNNRLYHHLCLTGDPAWRLTTYQSLLLLLSKTPTTAATTTAITTIIITNLHWAPLPQQQPHDRRVITTPSRITINISRIPTLLLPLQLP